MKEKQEKVSKISHHFQFQHSDCTLIADSQQAIQLAKNQLFQDWELLEAYTTNFPAWREAYDPIHIEHQDSNDPLIEDMEYSARVCNVGPMAAVAGSLADRMKKRMLAAGTSKIAVVENGGEISIKANQEIVISLAVLSSSLKTKLGFLYPGDSSDLGVATSSATFGHADSLGEADAVCVFAPNASLADAAATKICNEVKGKDASEAIHAGLNAFSEIKEIFGVFIVKNELVAKQGILPQIIRINDDSESIIQKKKKSAFNID